MILSPCDGLEIRISPDGCADLEFPDGVALALPVQTHAARVAIVRQPDETFPDTDGLISLSPEIAVGVRTADCQPVILFAPDIRAVAAVHAGWRGTIARISGSAVSELCRLGASPSLMRAFLGPAICGQCYEVSPELVDDFKAAGFAINTAPRHLDLADLNSQDLVGAGLRRANITGSEHCTLHTVAPRYPSWRRVPGTTTRLITAARLTL